MQWLQDWPLAAQVIAFVVAFNLSLSGIKQGLDVVKDKTKGNWDNAAAGFLGKVLSVLSKVVDAVGMNPKHDK